MNMRWDQIAGNWDVFKAQAALQWRELSPAQLDTIAGNRERLARCIRDQYGISAHAAEWQLSGWEQRQKSVAMAV